MQKIKRYDVSEGSNAEELTRAINSAIVDGMEPLNYVFCYGNRMFQEVVEYDERPGEVEEVDLIKAKSLGVLIKKISDMLVDGWEINGGAFWHYDRVYMLMVKPKKPVTAN
jgi:hypothetical protein